MENLYLRFGILIVVVVIIMLLINFAWKNVLHTEQLDEEQVISGDSKQIISKIHYLCKACISDIDQDCFLLRTSLNKGNIDASMFYENVDTDINLVEGEYILKISSKSNMCVVRQLA